MSVGYDIRFKNEGDTHRTDGLFATDMMQMLRGRKPSRYFDRCGKRPVIVREVDT